MLEVAWRLSGEGRYASFVDVTIGVLGVEIAENLWQNKQVCEECGLALASYLGLKNKLKFLCWGCVRLSPDNLTPCLRLTLVKHVIEDRLKHGRA